MSAIYQRARPITWEQVVGQEHVKDVLRGALEAGRVGHAYLFSGPRGVGKTTTARLIAMTANCQSAGKKPCGECESCRSVRSGSHPDVLEIDAASNNSVDDVRDLREKVGLSAMRGGKKIYILDEAHMMSRAAFNALLKTLEEPPEHVIFILATTEPEKIIPTILSRCQHYRFRRLTAPEIAGKLAGLVGQEGATAEPDALNLIGRLADGAMRDGESLLERMLAAGQAITRSGVEAALGLPPSERVREMAQALANLDAGPLLSGAAALYRDGYAARTVVEGLVSALGEALHAELGLEGEKLDGAQVPRLLRLQAALDAQEARFSRGADQLSLELALTHALIAGEGSGAAPVRPSAASSSALNPDDSARLARLEREISELKASGVLKASSLAAPTPQPQRLAAEFAAATPAQASPSQTSSASAPAAGNWADVLNLRETSAQLRAFLKPARMHAEAGYVSLSYDARGKFHAKQVSDKFDAVGKLVLKVFGPVTFELISPEHNRKLKLGGPESGNAGIAAPREPVTADVPVRTAPPVQEIAAAPLRAQPPSTQPPDDIPDFAPTGRRAAPAAGRTATLPPPTVPAAELPTTDLSDELPDFEPSVRPVSASRSDSLRPDSTRPDPIRPEPLPPSPDDVAPAPLPERAPPAQVHVADRVAAPEESQPAQAEPSVGQPIRETYIPHEPISQEPDWDDLGGPLETRAQASLEPIGSEITSPERAAAAPRSTPPKAAAVSTPGDVRSHPNYQEVTRLFSGRVKEIGKVKKRAVAESDDSGDGGEEGGAAEA